MQSDANNIIDNKSTWPAIFRSAWLAARTQETSQRDQKLDYGYGKGKDNGSSMVD